MGRRVGRCVILLFALALVGCAAARVPPARPLTEPELAAFTDLAVDFRCARQSWPESISELREFAEAEGVSLDWEPIERSWFSRRAGDVLVIHVRPEALPPSYQVSFGPWSGGTSTQASIGVLPRDCAAEKPETGGAEACEPIAADGIGLVDVAIVIDSSASTAFPSGFDVNRNGTVGGIQIKADELQVGVGRLSNDPRAVRAERARPEGLLRGAVPVGSTDPGDSVLAAQVEAARELIDHLAQADARFAIISHFDLEPDRSRRWGRRSRSASSGEGGATTRTGVTSDAAKLSLALDAVLEAGSAGGSKLSAAMDAANAGLLAAVDTTDARRRVVLLMSDSAFSTSIGAEGEVHRADPAMKTAAEAAIDSNIVFHTFGLGPAGIVKPPHALSRIAGATGGEYRFVGMGSRLSCELSHAVAPD